MEDVDWSGKTFRIMKGRYRNRPGKYGHTVNIACEVISKAVLMNSAEPP